MTLRLRHLHLNNVTPLPRAAQIQDFLVRQHLDRKALTSHKASSQATKPQPLLPTLLTFTPPPSYTTGRREIGTLSSKQIDDLRGVGKDAPSTPNGQTAEFYESQRGGQTTFHGPGQLVLYLICDLKTHNLTPKCYVRFLEDSVIKTVSRYGLKAHTTENPGVWIGEKGDGVARDDDRKVASVGVHLRRNVTSFGVGLNACTDLGWFDRVTACGLPGRKATSIEHERIRLGLGNEERKWEGYELTALARIWAGTVAKDLEGVEGVAEKVAVAEDGKVGAMEEKDSVNKGEVD